MKLVWFALLCLVALPTMAAVDWVKVDKSKRRMYLYEHGELVREYRIALGKEPKGHKHQEGDQRTPEGLYYLDNISAQTHFYKAFHISYPNKQDIAYAKLHELDPGGDVKVHGLKTERRHALSLFKVLIGPMAALPSPMTRWMSLLLSFPSEPQFQSSGKPLNRSQQHIQFRMHHPPFYS